jgi:hypothetical protein
MGKMRNACITSDEILERRTPFGRTWRRWEDNIKIELTSNTV